MIGLITLAVIAVWLLLITVAARALVRGFWKRPRQMAAQVLVATTIFFLPLGDEIVGGIQFAYECAKRDRVNIDLAATDSRRVKLTPFAQAPVRWMALPVTVYRVSYVDTDTGREVVGFDWLRARGGLVARSSKVFESEPIVFGGHCKPVTYAELNALLVQLNLTTTGT